MHRFSRHGFADICTWTQRLSKQYTTQPTVLFDTKFAVPTFCNLIVNCFYNVHVNPLDVFKYPNSNTVRVKLLVNNSTAQPDLQCTQSENNILIVSDDNNNNNKDITCCIEAPVKACIEVNGGEGSVVIGSFHNEYLKINTTTGDVCVDKFLSDKIRLTTTQGHITCKKVTQASDVSLKTTQGNVAAERLQGLILNVETKEGNISVDSSYCNYSTFKSKKGNITLKNAHKDCKTFIEDGNLHLLGFDGVLNARINRGNAEILLSRLLQDSYVTVEKEGAVILKVMEDCLNNTQFLIAAKSCHVGETITNVTENLSNVLIVEPKQEKQNTFSIDCKYGDVQIQTTSFVEMMGFIVQ